jgi:hypothetical protein
MLVVAFVPDVATAPLPPQWLDLDDDRHPVEVDTIPWDWNSLMLRLHRM